MLDRPEEPRRGPWSQPTFVFSVAVLGLVLVLGVVVFLTFLFPGSGDETAGDEGSQALTPADESDGQHALASESVCGLEGISQTVPDTAPDADWETVGTIHAPSISGEGPGAVADSGLRYCYAPTPTGALLATANVIAMTTDPLLFPEMAEYMITDGPGRQEAITGAEQPQPEDGGLRFEIAGYRFLDYGDGTARVDVAIHAPVHQLYMSFVYDLVWEDGDWKLQVNDNGSYLVPPAELPDLTGYVAWSGS